MKKKFKMVLHADEDVFATRVEEALNDGYELVGVPMIAKSAEYRNTDYFVQALVKTYSP